MTNSLLTFFMALGGYIFAAEAEAVSEWGRYGLLGLVLMSLFWLLKQFFDNTMVQQRDVTASIRQIHDLLAQQGNRFAEHIKSDESINNQILAELKEWNRMGRIWGQKRKDHDSDDEPSGRDDA